ncbi:MAG: cupredoxin domain-containing protein, partial [Acidimicrobiia bacterium]|nr:cupredoxin domain-containing protein [Acidimicrobiia bacterium]
FQPANATVSKGTTVRWRNRDGFNHTTTSNDGVWAATLFPDDRFSFTFSTPGTYAYICTIHPSMTGMITVTG